MLRVAVSPVTVACDTQDSGFVTRAAVRTVASLVTRFQTDEVFPVTQILCTPVTRVCLELWPRTEDATPSAHQLDYLWANNFMSIAVV